MDISSVNPLQAQNVHNMGSKCVWMIDGWGHGETKEKRSKKSLSIACNNKYVHI
jgi:hypothetical protein